MVRDEPTRPDHPTPLALAAVARVAGAATPTGAEDLPITGISLDSRRVQAGDLYAALPGAQAHGASFAQQAAASGAVAVLTDAAGRALVGEVPDLDLPVLVVDDPRVVLGAVASAIHGDPAASLRTIGVTGTQGKTTVTRLIDAGLLGAGVRSAVVGTVGTRIVGAEVKTSLTTPEAPDLHGLFARMRELDVAACAMEVSSHALVMGRVDGVVLDVAVFTNLGRDHLDFHADLDDYFAAKASLFTPQRARLGLVCVDDEHGRRLVAEAQIPTRSYAVDGPADWTVTDVEESADGSRFLVLGPTGQRVRAACPLPGRFNIANTLAAIAAAAEAGFPEQVVADAIAASGGVPGRLEQIATDRDLSVIVDYAHKPDAVDAVLRTLRPVTRGRLTIVIGAGGDRDRGKRPIMGQLAAELADVVIVTDDNPRSEDPALIRAEVLAGARAAERPGLRLEEIGDRHEAIRVAIAGAGPGDVVVIAGKGHESGQDVAGVVQPFDDREVARDVLASLPEATP